MCWHWFFHCWCQVVVVVVAVIVVVAVAVIQGQSETVWNDCDTHTKAQHCCRCLDCYWVSWSLNTFWPSPITIENSAYWHTTLYRFVFETCRISTWWAEHPVSFSSSKRALKANTDMWRPSLSCWMVSWFLKVTAHVATKQGLLPRKSSKIPSVILYHQPPGELLIVLLLVLNVDPLAFKRCVPILASEFQRSYMTFT